MSRQIVLSLEEYTKALLDAYERGRKAAQEEHIASTPPIAVNPMPSGGGTVWPFYPKPDYGTFGSGSINVKSGDKIYTIKNIGDDANKQPHEEFAGILPDDGPAIFGSISSTGYALAEDDDQLDTQRRE